MTPRQLSDIQKWGVTNSDVDADMKNRWEKNAQENAAILAAHPEWSDPKWIPGTGNPSYGLSMDQVQERDKRLANDRALVSDRPNPKIGDTD